MISLFILIVIGIFSLLQMLIIRKIINDKAIKNAESLNLKTAFFEINLKLHNK